MFSDNKNKPQLPSNYAFINGKIVAGSTNNNLPRQNLKPDNPNKLNSSRIIITSPEIELLNIPYLNIVVTKDNNKINYVISDVSSKKAKENKEITFDSTEQYILIDLNKLDSYNPEMGNKVTEIKVVKDYDEISKYNIIGGKSQNPNLVIPKNTKINVYLFNENNVPVNPANEYYILAKIGNQDIEMIPAK